jgi:hypothetical protein
MRARSIADCRAPSWLSVSGVDERLVVGDVGWATLASVRKDYTLRFPSARTPLMEGGARMQICSLGDSLLKEHLRLYITGEGQRQLP